MRRDQRSETNARRHVHGVAMKRVLTITLIVVAIAAGSTARPQSAASHWPLEIKPIVSPAAPDSGQPQLTVSDRGVLLSWIEHSGTRATLKFAERTGAAWSEPKTVTSGDDLLVNWADVPSVLRLADGTLAAHWLQTKGAPTAGYDVRLSYSKDNGKTWSASFMPHHDGTAAEHGFASLFQMPGGVLGLIWLDGRAKKGGHGAPGGGGDMSVRSASFTRDWKQTGDIPVDLRVCECCPTTVAITTDGPIAAFRDRSSDEVRDIAVTRLEDGKWSEPVAVHPDNWRINGCPVNGPALSARGRTLAIAWFTAKGAQPQAYVAFSKDAGRTFGEPIRLDDHTTQGRVDIELLPDGSAAVLDIERADTRAQVRVRRVEASGAKSEAVRVARIDGSGPTSGFPRLAFHDNELVFTWIERENERTLGVRTAVARLP
jgi:hypothetical protein